MNLPLKLELPYTLKKINDFSVVWFQDNSLTNPSPHWYIMIPTKETSCFLVAIITSRSAERAAYYKRTNRPKAVECLVRINNDVFSFLRKDSVVNCNVTEYLTAKEIIHRIDEATGFKIEQEKVPAYLKKDIVSAIVRSPLISKFIGNVAKAANPL